MTSNFGGLENINPNRDLIEEDCPLKIGEWKKKPHNSRFSSVSSGTNSRKTTDGHTCVHDSEISIGFTGHSSQMQRKSYARMFGEWETPRQDATFGKC